MHAGPYIPSDVSSGEVLAKILHNEATLALFVTQVCKSVLLTCKSYFNLYLQRALKCVRSLGLSPLVVEYEIKD